MASRRSFLKTSLGLSTFVSLAPSVPAFLSRTAEAANLLRDPDDTILIVVQLAGGNDGLNTVVPYADDQYGRSRTTLRLPEKDLHKIDSHLGFHPQMPGLHRLFQEGLLTVVQGVGYPNPSQDHAAAMHVWQTGCPSRADDCQTGWVGRAVDRMYKPEEGRVPAAFVGDLARPFGINAQRAIIPSLRSLDEATLRALPGSPSQSLAKQSAETRRASGDNPVLQFIQRTTVGAQASSQQIEAAAKNSTGAADYPQFQFAKTLRTIAQLIRANQGIRIFFTELGGEEPGGFDNHANQRDNHAALLRQMSQSIVGFVNDLKRDKLLDRVVLMTFSEFGRTVQENGRRGTDHGSAAPMFLVGSRLRGGLVGEHPNLTDLENGGQKHHTDFRRVYATMLDRWLGVDSQPVLDGKFQPLDLVKV